MNLCQNTAEFNYVNKIWLLTRWAYLFIYVTVHDYLFIILHLAALFFPSIALSEQTHFWVVTDQLRATDPVHCKGWECDFSHGEITNRRREQEREQLLGSGRSWHHHLWAPRVALGARQSQPVPGCLTAIQPDSLHTPSPKRPAITRLHTVSNLHCTEL